jgi:hypothetical protein
MVPSPHEQESDVNGSGAAERLREHLRARFPAEGPDPVTAATPGPERTPANSATAAADSQPQADEPEE